MAIVAAEPSPFDLIPAQAGLVIIDMQRDFFGPGGFGAALGNDVSLRRRTIAPTRRLLDAARMAGIDRHPHSRRASSPLSASHCRSAICIMPISLGGSPRNEGRSDLTAMPYGPSVPRMFIVVFLIMLPICLKTHDPLLAWQSGLVWCLIIGAIVLLGAFVGPTVRKYTPRAAMLGTLAPHSDRLNFDAAGISRLGGPLALHAVTDHCPGQLDGRHAPALWPSGRACRSGVGDGACLAGWPSWFTSTI
jgi:hypothetical protein